MRSSLFRRAVLLALVCVAGVFCLGSTAFAAGTVAWSGEFPAQGAAMNTPSASTIAVDLVGSQAITAASQKVTVDGVAVVTRQTYLTFKSGTGNTAASVLAYVNIAKEGMHTVSVSVKNSSGSTFADAWTFSIAVPPTLGAPTPAAGSLVTVTSPVIEIPAFDQSGIVSCSATVNGAAVPAFYSASTGRVSVVPPAPLDNDSAPQVKVTVADIFGNSRSATWSFIVQTKPDMVKITTCLTCHPGTDTDNDMGAICADCHTAAGGYHPGAPSTYHAAADVGSCKPCHQSSITVEHTGRITKAGDAITCATCHTSTDPAVRAAIATKNSACSACHPGGSGHESLHTTVVTPGCDGTGCHSGTSLTSIHINSGTALSCDSCHKSTDSKVVAAIAGGDKSCTACHDAAGHEATHDSAVVPACSGAGCHTGTNLTLVHTGGCDTCHESPDAKVEAAIAAKDKSCTACHDSAAPHGNIDASHTATVQDATIKISGTDYGTHACSECHATSVITTLHADNCKTCHPTANSSVVPAWDRTCVAAGCHSLTSTKPMHASIDASHAIPASKASCLAAGCHDAGGMAPFAGKSVAELHKNKLGCATCHADGKTPTTDCTTAGCHADRLLPHGYTADKHLASPTAQAIIVNGTSYGPIACATCHDSLELGPIHLTGTASCATCHDTLVPGLELAGGWDKSCTQGGCHTVTSAKPMHPKVTSAHLRPTGTAADACFASGCHTGSADLAAIHAGKLGCATCHGSGKTPVADCATVGCHDMAAPHGDVNALHASSGGSAFVSAGMDNYDHGLGDGEDANCADCHARRLLSVHANNCATCHATSVRGTVQTAIANHVTDCTACHPSQHTGYNSSHESLYDSGDYSCGGCHGYGCTQCHGVDNAPPSTTTNVRPSYIGTASITFTASDASGVQASYYRLDGGAKTTVSGALLVAPPAAGSKSHTLDYWSVDAWDNAETVHSATFGVSADTTAPVTTSDARALYWGDVAIHLTATDNATVYGVRTTYYQLDNGPVSAGTTFTFPFAGSEAHTLYFWSVDYAGNVEAQQHTDFAFGVGDKIAPTTTSSFNPAFGAAVNSNKTVTLTPTDNTGGSGVQATYYKIDSSAFASGTSFTVAGDGLHTFNWYSVDFAGNVETTQVSQQFRIDTVAPVTTSNAYGGAAYYGAQTFTLAATDTNGSGVATTQWQLDSTAGAWTTGTSVAVPAPASGTMSHTIYWYSTDNAGNVELQRSATVQIAQGYAAGSVINATGAPAYFTVPAGATALTVDLYGGQGSPPGVGQVGGKGGYLKATLAVTPGQTLTIKVGKAGNLLVGGWGGGSGGNGSTASAGGGSTSIALGSSVLAEAGGGGGAGWGSGGDGGAWSVSVTGGNAAGGAGNYCGGGGGWTSGATGKYVGLGGTSRTSSGSYTTCTQGGNSTMADGWMTMTWSTSYTLSYTAGANGTISGTTPQTVASGGSGTAVTAVPNSNYHFVSWSDGLATATRTEASVAADKSVTANFAINTYTLTYTAGAGGTIGGTSPQTVNYNGSGTAVSAAATSGYQFTSWSDGVGTATRTDAGVVADKSVTANFTLVIVDVTPPTTTSSFNPAANAIFTSNQSVTLTATDNAGGSGVATTYYKMDSGAYASGTAFTVTDGLHTFSYYSTDKAGNAETAHVSNQFRVDTLAPVTTSNAASGGSYYGDQAFALSAADTNGSGVATTKWQLDSTAGAWTTGSSVSVPAPSSGTVSHTLYWYSTDIAGNAETIKSVAFQSSAVYTKGSVISATGAPMSFTVPPSVGTLTVNLYGAQGSPPGVGQVGGIGGYLKTNIAVTPGQVLTIKVGKAGNLLVGGWGGGFGGNGTSVSAGGGSTSIALGSAVLAEAGGGGGAGMGNGGAGGTWSATAGGNAVGGTGNWCGGGGGWTSGATGKYGGFGGTSGASSGTYVTCTPGGNTTSADGWMSMTW